MQQIKRSYLLTCAQGDSEDEIASLRLFKKKKMDTTLRISFKMHVKMYLELKFTVEKVTESLNSNESCKRIHKFENTYFTISKD